MSTWGPVKYHPPEPLWNLASSLGFWDFIHTFILWYLWKFSALSSFLHPWLLWKWHLVLKHRHWGNQMCLWGSGAQPKEPQSCSNCQFSQFFEQPFGSLGLWCFEGHFQEVACAPGDKIHFSCSCITTCNCKWPKFPSSWSPANTLASTHPPWCLSPCQRHFPCTECTQKYL